MIVTPPIKPRPLVAPEYAVGVNLFGELSVSRSGKRNGDAKVLPWLRHTDTFPERRFLDSNATCGKVSATRVLLMTNEALTPTPP